MYRILCLLSAICLLASEAKSQCNAAFTFTVNQNQVSFSATSTSSQVKHVWQFGDGYTASPQPAALHVYGQPGVYTVTHIVRDSVASCNDTVLQTVTLSFTPVCNVSFSSVRVAAGSGEYRFYPAISAPGSGLQSITWTVNGTPVSTQQVMSYTFPAAGTYYICAAIQALSGCTAQACDTIQYQPDTLCHSGTSFTAIADPVQKRRVTFTAQPTLSQRKYTWSFGDQSAGSGSPVTHLYAAPGTYAVKLLVTDSISHCLDTVAATVQVQAPASESCTASFSYTVGQGGQVAFTALSNQPIQSQTWTIINAADSSATVVLTTPDPTYTFADTGYYQVCLKVITDSGCTASWCSGVQVHNTGRMAAEMVASYPNPAGNASVIRFRIDLPAAATIHYTVYNLTGRAVYQAQRRGGQGTNVIALPVQQLGQGQYFIDISAGHKQFRSIFQKL